MSADLTVGEPEKPEIDAPDQDAPDRGDAPIPEDDAPEVPEDLVRGLLVSLGTGAHYVSGDARVPEHWKFTRGELDGLTPPLTRVINRRPALRRAAHYGDALTIATTLTGYAGRNVMAARAADRDDEHQEDDGGDKPRQAGPATTGPAAPVT